MVVDHVRSFRLKEPDQAWVIDVHLHQSRIGMDVLLFSRAQIVHHNDLVPGAHVRIDDVRADEPSPSGDHYLHGSFSPYGALGMALL